MVSDERIRKLCERVVKSVGEDFETALLELQQEIELRADGDQQNDEKSKAV